MVFTGLLIHRKHKNIHNAEASFEGTTLWIMWTTILRGGFPRFSVHLRHP